METISLPPHLVSDRSKILYILKVVGPTCPCALAAYLGYFPDEPVYPTLVDMLAGGDVGVTLEGPEQAVVELREVLRKHGLGAEQLAGRTPAEPAAYQAWLRAMKGSELNMFYSISLTRAGEIELARALSRRLSA